MTKNIILYYYKFLKTLKFELSNPDQIFVQCNYAIFTYLELIAERCQALVVDFLSISMHTRSQTVCTDSVFCSYLLPHKLQYGGLLLDWFLGQHFQTGTNIIRSA